MERLCEGMDGIVCAGSFKDGTHLDILARGKDGFTFQFTRQGNTVDADQKMTVCLMRDEARILVSKVCKASVGF